MDEKSDKSDNNDSSFEDRSLLGENRVAIAEISNESIKNNIIKDTTDNNIIDLQNNEKKNDEIIENLQNTTKACKESVPKVLIDIKFRNKKTYFAFHEEFLEIIKKYYKKELDDLDILDDASNSRISISERLVKKSDSFLIDTTPNIDLSKSLSETTPRYNTLFTKSVLSSIKDEDLEKTSLSSNRCFNCDKGSHTLRQCPEPRNFQKIRKARNEFNKKELRYHEENEDFDLIPGKLSSDLQVALGITENQLPLHVYKMRKYGYPPAWLDEAKIYCSGLEIHDDKVHFENENLKGNFKYDIQKIFDFPGFNVAPNCVPFVDKHRLLNLPPMLPEHSKAEFLFSLRDFIADGYSKRRKTIEQTIINDFSSNIERTEMDIVNDEDHVNEDFSPRSPVEDGELSNNSDHSVVVEELQKERNKIISELSNINNFEIDTTKDDSMENSGHKKFKSEINSTGDHGFVETTIFGCPLLPSVSDFECLPAGGKFQQGVSDVIAFENLAESTGKYQKMKGLIKKVRIVVKENQKK